MNKCVDCGTLDKKEPLYIKEETGEYYCAICMISELAEKGIIYCVSNGDGNFTIIK